MDSYALLKLLHILAAVVVAGTGTGIAFFMLMAYRSKNVQAIAVTTRHVVLADWLFTAPAVVTQLITGLLLMKTLGYSYTSQWFVAVVGLFILVGMCWAPVLVLQYRLRALALDAESHNALPDQFEKHMTRWIALGISAFIAILVIFWLMVFKPLPVV